MKTKLLLLAALAALGLGLSGDSLFGHCEIPCGIYTDPMRVQMIEEHCKTIEKAMAQIAALSKEHSPTASNQIARWVANKEKHAGDIQQIVTQYFMTQRVKPADPSNKKAYAAYVKKLTTLHGILVSAMKCKQTTDATHVEKLRAGLKEFSALYFVK
jgi:nickel superoxide dismutase